MVHIPLLISTSSPSLQLQDWLHIRSSCYGQTDRWMLGLLETYQFNFNYAYQMLVLSSLSLCYNWHFVRRDYLVCWVTSFRVAFHNRIRSYGYDFWQYLKDGFIGIILGKRYARAYFFIISRLWAEFFGFSWIYCSATSPDSWRYFFGFCMAQPHIMET